MSELNAVTRKVLLETSSRIMRQSVIDSVSSMGIEVCDQPNDEIVLRLMGLSAHDCAPVIGDTQVPIVFIGGEVPSSLTDLAAASVPFPFLSNDLRKTVGRILQLRVADGPTYDVSDRPVPVSRKVDTQPVVAPKAVQSSSQPSTAPRESVSVVVPQLETQGDLPSISSLEEAPLHYAEDTLAPKGLAHPAPGNAMGADVIETISEAYIEKVVWEVVPRLAERILREEIARLLRETSNGG
jgi:hypothetical protein